jgi:hypothetical protein
MVKDVKLEPGWLKRDVERAAKRVEEWTPKPKKPLTYADGLRRAAEIAQEIAAGQQRGSREAQRKKDRVAQDTLSWAAGKCTDIAAAIEAEIAKEKG